MLLWESSVILLCYSNVQDVLDCGVGTGCDIVAISVFLLVDFPHVIYIVCFCIFLLVVGLSVDWQ